MQTILGSEASKKTKRLHIGYALLITNLFVWGMFTYEYNKCYQSIQEQEQKLFTKTAKTSGLSIDSVDDNENVEPTDMREWVKWKIKNSGLNWDLVSCTIKNESGWNQYAINKNTNRTFDVGLWQINDIHRLPRECGFDYKCSTEWAIKKIKRDGNMKAWYGYTKNCK